MDQSERRAEVTTEIVRRTGIDDAMIERVVRTFYGKVRGDTLLGPVFSKRIADWEAHLQRLCDFWSSVALLTGRYSGRPMEKHMPLPVDAQHFDRWITLFEETVRQICEPVAAEHFMERARRIAESLELGVAGHNGVILMKGERFRPSSPGPIRDELKISEDMADERF
ncbi:group III truncated hemoglobin [Amorphus sp. MBR-141]